MDSAIRIQEEFALSLQRKFEALTASPATAIAGARASEATRTTVPIGAPNRSYSPRIRGRRQTRGASFRGGAAIGPAQPQRAGE